MRPTFSIRTEDAELSIDTFCADRRLPSGVLTLRTAGGAHTGPTQAEAQPESHSAHYSRTSADE